jgi:hypothetical protein
MVRFPQRVWKSLVVTLCVAMTGVDVEPAWAVDPPHVADASRSAIASQQTGRAVGAAGQIGAGQAGVVEDAASAGSRWPCLLTVDADLRPAVELAWRHSAAFGDQCRKLAATGARMMVRSVSSREMWRAQTRIQRMRDGAIIARAVVRPSHKSVELISHELEHLLEYLEGVDFLMEAHRGGSRVSLKGGAYETRRALEAGRRVAREVRDAAIASQRSRTSLPTEESPWSGYR